MIRYQDSLIKSKSRGNGSILTSQGSYSPFGKERLPSVPFNEHM